jgi:hypothetical protein
MQLKKNQLMTFIMENTSIEVTTNFSGEKFQPRKNFLDDLELSSVLLHFTFGHQDGRISHQSAKRELHDLLSLDNSSQARDSAFIAVDDSQFSF